MGKFSSHCVKSGQDCTYTMTVSLVSDFKRVQEGKYVCSCQLGVVFFAGEAWHCDFLERITLGVFSWNVCLQEQRVAEWHADICLVNDQSSTEQYTAHCLNH